MKILNQKHLTNLLTCFLIMGFVACTPTKEVKAPTKGELLIGTWLLDKLVMGEQEFPASMMGGEISFNFKADGSVVLNSPKSREESAKYTLTDGIIIIDDGETPLDSPEARMIIVNIDKEKLALLANLEGQEVQMDLKRKITVNE